MLALSCVKIYRMARFDTPPEKRGLLDIEDNGGGLLTAYFVPLPDKVPSSGDGESVVFKRKILELDSTESVLTIFPLDTRYWSDSFLEPKYSKITEISIHYDSKFYDLDIYEALENLPSGFTKDYNYGLGLVWEFNAIIGVIEENSECTRIELIHNGTTELVGDTFRILSSDFQQILKELDKIASRGSAAVRRVKKFEAHNFFAKALGVSPEELSFGRKPDSIWITQSVSGIEKLSTEKQKTLLETTISHAPSIAKTNPEALTKLQQDIEVVNLEQLIDSFKKEMKKNRREAYWQKFFELNIFSLQLVLGGPTIFVSPQVSIGPEERFPGNRKIADYLLHHTVTGNVNIVEIKKPSTKLLRKREYREGVFGIQGEIDEAITQVLDQALSIARNEQPTKLRLDARTGWTASSPRCFVIAGTMDELDTDEKRKSFELYRGNLSAVRLITFDEILDQMVALHSFLTASS